MSGISINIKEFSEAAHGIFLHECSRSVNYSGYKIIDEDEDKLVKLILMMRKGNA